MRTHGLWFDVNCSILFTELPLVSLNFHTGDMAAGVDRDTQDAVAIGNLRLAAQAASKVGASVLVEAINSVDVPGTRPCERRWDRERDPCYPVATHGVARWGGGVGRVRSGWPN